MFENLQVTAVATPGPSTGGPPIGMHDRITMHCGPNLHGAERLGNRSQKPLQTLGFECQVNHKRLREHGLFRRLGRRVYHRGTETRRRPEEV